jgi:hypothetical protein
MQQNGVYSRIVSAIENRGAGMAAGRKKSAANQFKVERL